MNQQIQKKQCSRSPLHVALIGLNGVNRWLFLPALQRSGELTLVAGVSPTPATRQSFSKLSPVPVYETFDEMIARESLDAVIIGSPTHLHPAHVRHAAEAGLHILVTKPLCNTVAECQSAIEATCRAGVILEVGHEFRYRPPMRRMLELACAGDSGPVGVATMLMMHMGHARGLTEDPATASWRADAANIPGGSGNLLGVHGIDLANAVFGKPRRVCAGLRHLRARLPLEDTTAFTIEYDTGIAVITTSYASQPLEHAFVLGTRGNLFARESQLTLEVNRQARPLEDLSTEGAADCLLRQFAAAIREGVSPESDGQAGIAAVAVLECALRSARERRTIDVIVPDGVRPRL